MKPVTSTWKGSRVMLPGYSIWLQQVEKVWSLTIATIPADSTLEISKNKNREKHTRGPRREVLWTRGFLNRLGRLAGRAGAKNAKSVGTYELPCGWRVLITTLQPSRKRNTKSQNSNTMLLPPSSELLYDIITKFHMLGKSPYPPKGTITSKWKARISVKTASAKRRRTRSLAS